MKQHNIFIYLEEPIGTQELLDRVAQVLSRSCQFEDGAKVQGEWPTKWQELTYDEDGSPIVKKS